MRIVWLLDGLGLGGAERLALHFAAAAAAAPGVAFELITLRTAPAPLAGVWGPEGEDASRCVRELGMRRLADPAGWLRLLREWRRSPPALVHAHLRYATVWGGAAAWALGIPYITTVHLGPGREPTRRQAWAAGLERAARRRAARVIYVGEAQREAWRCLPGAAREAAVVIPNGVAAAAAPAPGARARHGIAPGACVMTTVAMVRARKGWRTWLEAVARIAPLRPGAVFVWVGGGPELGALQAAAAASPWPERIRVVGSSTQVGEWLGLSNLFLFPSEEEAQPTAVLEAMAAGVPVIASALPAIREVLADCGRMVPVGDAAALAEAALTWSAPAGAAAARNAAVAARARVAASYGEAAWSLRLLDLYREVLGEHARAYRRPLRPLSGPRPKILLIEFFGRGGLLHYSWQLAQGLAAEAPGAEVVLLTGRRPECAGVPAGVRLLARLRTWNPHRPRRFLPRRLVRAARGVRYLFAWLQVLRATRQLDPAVILLGDLEHRCDAWFVRHLARRGRGRGQVADIWHNVEAFERTRRGRLLRHPAWRPRLAREFAAVFVHGPALAAQLERLTGVRARVIAHGNQSWIAAQAGPDPGLDRRFSIPRGRPLALLFGTVTAYKGVEVLLEALAAIPEPRRPTILIAGMPTAAVRPELWRRAAQRMGLEPWLRWDLRYVPTPETAWYFRRADLVVLPYLTASQSGVAHLALTFGKPLIVTEVGGLPEIIDGNGLVVPPGQAPALAAALERLGADAALRQRLGRRSAELAASRHDWRSVAQAVLAVFPALGSARHRVGSNHDGNADRFSTKAAPAVPRSN